MNCVTASCTAVVSAVVAANCATASCTANVSSIVDVCAESSCLITVIDEPVVIDGGCSDCEVTVSGGCKDVLVKSCKLDDCIVCCEPHQSGFFWNNWCLCDDASVISSGSVSNINDSYDGTEAANACDCAYTQSLKFRGTGTYTVTLPESKSLDAVVLWGHNLHEGADGIQSGLVQVEADGQIIQPNNWDLPYATVEADEPVFMFFDSDEYSTVTIKMYGATDNQTGIANCVDNIFIGECLDIPDGLRSFINPFNGSEYESKIKSSSCGPLSRSLNKKPIEFDLEIQGLCYEWLIEKWRPFVCYMQRYPAYFSWSKNRYPSEVARVWIDSQIAPSEFEDSHFSSVTLSLNAQITQSKK